MNSDSINQRLVEATLLSHSLAEDCAVLARNTPTDGEKLVAYVVPAGPFSAEKLRAHLQAALPGVQLPDLFVPMSVLPRDAEGKLDLQALHSIQTITPALLERWQDAVRGVEGIEQAAVVVQDQAARLAPLHLGDLLPDWREKSSAAETHSPAHRNESLAQDGQPGEAIMSFAFGGPLHIPESAPRTLIEALQCTATLYPDKGITYVQPDGSEILQCYPELLDGARRILSGLYARGLKPRDRAILQLDSLRDHFTTFWACVLGGITPVTVAIAPSFNEPNSVVNKLFNTWKLLGKPAVIASDRLIEALAGLEEFLPMSGLRILPAGDLKKNPPAAQIHQSQPEDLVFFQLTSGSTGVPKCIQETHRGIIRHILGSAQFCGFSSGDVSLNWLPVDHVVPILTYHLKDTFLGCRQVQLKTEAVLADPLKWLDCAEKHRVTHSWSPNFGFKLVAEALAKAPERRWDLSSLKFLMNAGEQCTLPVIRDFLTRVAPFGVKPQVMQPAFGMAEVCTCMTYANDFTLENGVHRAAKSSLGGVLRETGQEDSESISFVDLGPVIPGVEIRIADSENKIVPEGVIGRLQIKGGVVTPGYLNNEPANQEAFVGGGWFNSGDLGFMRKGRLTLTGREKEMIIVRGANFYCYEIEDVVNRIDGVEPTFVAACAVADSASGTEGLAIFFVPSEVQNPTSDHQSQKSNARSAPAVDFGPWTLDPGLLVKSIRTRVTAEMGLTPAFVIPLAKKDFPKTTSGKIQRSQLKKSLEAGAFKDVIKQVDIVLESSNTIPDWFFRKVWQPKEAFEAAHGNQTCVAFLDSHGLGQTFFAEANRQGQLCVGVEAGSQFVKFSSITYRIDPGNPDHYRLLLESLARDQIVPGVLLHLWTFGAQDGSESRVALENNLRRGVYSVLYLAQAHAQIHGQKHPARLLVVSSFAQAVGGAESVAPEHCALTGLLRSIPQEMPWLKCSHADVDPAASLGSALPLHAVLAELNSMGNDVEVAWRGGRRYVARLEKADLLAKPAHGSPFKRGGIYLLTGGLGGIGAEVARYLLTQYEARLIVTGQSVLHEPAHAGDSHAGAKIAGRIKTLRELESLPGEVVYEPADAAKAEAVEQLLSRAARRWNASVDGVIHLAGTFAERFLAEETPESFAEVLRPKVLGSWALAKALRGAGNSKCLFISFSSVNGTFGGATVGAYAAANSFVDGFAHTLRREGFESYCVAWSPWDETGMSRGYQMKAVSRSRGYYSIAARQGIQSLAAALERREPHLIAGLDNANAQIRRQLAISDTSSAAQQRVTAFFSTHNGAHVPALRNLEVRDDFGTRSVCEFRQLKELPRKADGSTDCEKLCDSRGSGRTAPRNELEKQIAAVWQEALGVSQIGVDDNFFELGGHSLLAAQIVFRLQEACKTELPMRCLFDAPTVARLACLISERCTHAARSAAAADSQPALPRVAPAPEMEHEPFPLTEIQQAYWLGRTGAFELGRTACHLYAEAEFRALDVARFNTALQCLIERHPMLRAVILPDGRQRILNEVPQYEIQLADLRDMSSESAEEQLEAVREELSHQILPADHAPLFEIRASQLHDRVRLHCSFDLLIGDAKSFEIIIRELSELYEHPERPLPPLELTFRDYCAAAAQIQDTELYRRSKEYWLKRLTAIASAPELPLAKSAAAIERPRFTRHSTILGAGAWSRLKKKAQALGLTPSGVLLSALAETLGVWAKNPRFSINLTLFNRLPLHPQAGRIVGDFTSSMLFSAERAARGTFEARAKHIQDQLWNDLDHRYFSGVQVIREMAKLQPGSAPQIMPVVFTSILDVTAGSEIPALLKLGQFTYGATQTPQVSIDNQVYENAGVLHCNWDVVEELYPPGMIGEMFAAYSRLLHDLAAGRGWQANWSEAVRAALPESQKCLIAEAHATDAPISRKLLHELFSEQAAQQPGEPAVIHDDLTCSYRNIDVLSNQLARKLREGGAKPNTLIAVVLEKGWEQIPAVLGILKSGAAYLPLDPEFPAERMRYLLSHGEVAQAVTAVRTNSRIAWPANIERVCIDDPALAELSGAALPATQQPEDLAYVIYTSGSTGVPKGVAIDHRGAVNTILDINRRFGVATQDRVLALSSLGFDLSVYDIFGILAAGGAVVVPSHSGLKDPAHWTQLAGHHRVTIWNSVPALMQLAVQHAQERKSSSLSSLRLVMLSGDWIPVSLPDRIKALVPAAETVSLGGATEASIWSILYPIREVGADWNSIPYGKAMRNQRFHVLNETLEPCPVWTPGNLYIGGVGLARDYWRDEERTRASFIHHPATGERLYRTGDLGRWLPDGNIEFLGREDFQVKVNGYRIELGEIETALERHAHVRQAVVVAHGERDNKRLIAYVSTRDGLLDASGLQAHLRQSLPEYMVPAAFIHLEKLPLTSNGKVDRRALPAPDSKPQRENGYVAPRNKVEEVLAGMLAEVLGAERLGVFDNFFEMGGHSLFAIQALSRLRDTFEVDLPPNGLFEAPTVAGLAALLLQDPERRRAIEKTAELFLALADIPEEEADAWVQTGVV